MYAMNMRLYFDSFHMTEIVIMPFTTWVLRKWLGTLWCFVRKLNGYMTICMKFFTKRIFNKHSTSLRLVEIESLSFFTWRVPWGGLVQPWLSFEELDSCVLSSHSPNIIDFHWLQDILKKNSHPEILGTQRFLGPCMLVNESRMYLGIHTDFITLEFFFAQQFAIWWLSFPQ